MIWKNRRPIALMSVFAMCLGACAAETDDGGSDPGNAQGDPGVEDAAADQGDVASSGNAATGETQQNDTATQEQTQEAQDPLIVSPYVGYGGYGYGYGYPGGYGYGYPGGCIVSPWGYRCASGYSSSYGTGYGYGYPYYGRGFYGNLGYGGW